MAIDRSTITLPTEVSTQILQKAQEASAVMQLANRITLPGRGLTIPMITGDPAASWVAEGAQKPVDDPALSTKTMQAYKLAVIVPFSEEFRRDSGALYDALVSRLPNALGQKFDSTVFHGTAPGSNFDVFADCDKQSIAAGSTYAGLVAADAAIAANGGIVNGYVLSPQARAILLAEKDNNKRPLFVNSAAEGAIPMILGAPVHQSRAAYQEGSPNVLGVVGDWTQAYCGIVSGVNVTISDQATLTTSSGTINLWQQNMFAVRAEIEIGFIADTDCFNLLTD